MSDAGRKNPHLRLGAGWVFVSTLAALVMVSGSIGLASPADHLLLAEIQTLNNDQVNRPLSSEYIEVFNPTDEALDLSDVYLSDAIYAPGNQFYYRIAEGDPSGATAGGGAFNDFHARFPAGYSIAAGDTVVIAIEGSAGYENAYGRLPDFELFEDGNAPDQVPELLEAFPGSIDAGLGGGGNVPSLTDGSESLILYTWDGTSDLVQDLDFAFWGTSSSILFDKTGVTVGSGTYLADTPTTSQVRISSDALVFGQSYMRNDDDEGSETGSGGNGIGGHDETSENLGSTWTVAADRDPAMQPDTFFPVAPFITDFSVSPAAPYAGQEVTLSVTAESYGGISSVTFYVAYDRGPFNPVNGTDAGGGTFNTTLSGRDEGTHVAWYAVAVNSSGGEAFYPAGGEASAREWTVTSEPIPTDDPDKLLFSEICTLGTEFEFVEITNPNNYDVDMSDYYLTDAIYSPGNQFYWRIAEGNPGPSTIGGGAFGDFHARFPAGFTIAAGDTIVVTCPGSAAFTASFGFLPDLELYEDDAFPDAVPDMVPVWGEPGANSIVGADSTPGLSNGAEIVILYHWQEGQDLVKDIDVFSWKDPSSTTTSFFFDKTGVTVGNSTYAADTPTSQQHPFGVTHEFGFSYQRTDPSEGGQSVTGGNGVNGRDETSEDFEATFTDQNPVDPSRPAGSDGGPGSSAKLIVEAKTFIPTEGEIFPIGIVSKARSETKLRLFDLEGRLVHTLFDSRFNGIPSVIPEAPTVVPWDGRDQFYERVKAGMYIAHLLVVDNRTGEETTLTAPVVVATRLSK